VLLAFAFALLLEALLLLLLLELLALALALLLEALLFLLLLELLALAFLLKALALSLLTGLIGRGLCRLLRRRNAAGASGQRHGPGLRAARHRPAGGTSSGRRAGRRAGRPAFRDASGALSAPHRCRPVARFLGRVLRFARGHRKAKAIRHPDPAIN